MSDKKLIALTPAIERKRFLADEHKAVQLAIESFAVHYARELVTKLGQDDDRKILQELGTVLRYCPSWFENIANPLRNADGSYPHQLVSNLYRHKFLDSKFSRVS